MVESANGDALFGEKEQEQVKAFVLQKLENVADADPDVLGDYIIALLKNPGTVEEVKAVCVEQLKDFIEGGTEGFVEELFAGLVNKSYLKVGNGAQPTLPPKKRTIADVLGPYEEPSVEVRQGAQVNGAQPRKVDQKVGENRRHQGPRIDRFNQKQPSFRPDMMMPNMMMPLPPMEMMPPYDPNAPIMPLLWPGMDFSPNGLMPAEMTAGININMYKKAARCRDFDRRGYCIRGEMCPYQHGMTAITAPQSFEEYDPTSPGAVAKGRGFSSIKARGVGARRGRVTNRMKDSSPGMAHDQSIKTLIVQNIPSESLSEEAVRDYFSKFGTLTNVKVELKNAKAHLEFETRQSAQTAYDCPDVIFNNRFVKVFWKRKETVLSDKDVPMADAAQPSALELEEKQRKHEDFMKRVKATEEKAAKIQQQKEELEARQAEAHKLLHMKGNNDETGPSTDGQTSESDRSGLLKQLAALKAEADSLGLELSNDNNAPNTRGSWRGGIALRGNRGRGRGYGGYFTGPPAKSKKLDLRTNKVLLSDWDSNHDEVLRTFLLGIGEYESIEPSTEEPGKEIITFKNKWTAEKFLRKSGDVPGIGKIKSSWILDTRPPVAKVSPSVGQERSEAMEDVAGGDDDEMHADKRWR